VGVEWEVKWEEGALGWEKWEGESNGAMLRCPQDDGQTDNLRWGSWGVMQAGGKAVSSARLSI